MSISSTIAILTKLTGRYTTIGSIQLDASVEEIHTTSTTITSHPVEDGSDISDHVNRNPDALQIRGIISNTSTIFPQALPGVALVTAGINAVQGVTSDLAAKAYAEFLNLIDSKQLVTISTTLRTYDNMLIENLSVTRNSERSDCLDFTCTAREVVIVQTSILGLTAIVQGGVQGGKKSLGKKATQPLNTPTQTKANAQGSTLFSTLVGG